MFRSDLKKINVPKIDVPKKDLMMCLNESDLDPFEAVKTNFLKQMQDIKLNRYFSEITTKIFDELVKYNENKITESNILIGNGADDLLYATFNAVRENNDSYAISLAPSYFDYQTYSRATGLGIKFLDIQKDFSFDEKKFVEMSGDENCKIAILCQPNNPTGKLMSDEKILYILDRIKDKPVLIDETYFEFSHKTYIDLLKKYPNLILIRSFSKGFSAAGLRFGYLISSKYNCEQIKKGRLIFYSSIFIQTLVFTMLKNKKIFLDHTEKVIEQREILLNKLQKIPEIKTYSSKTNFLIFTIGKNSQKLFEYISNQNIAIRNVGKHPILKDHLRVTISTEENNDKFLNCIKTFLKNKDSECI